MSRRDELLNWIREILPVTVTLIFALVLFLAVQILGGMEEAYFILCAQIIGFCWLIYLVFASYRVGRRRDLERELNQVREEKKALEESTLRKQKELEDYFLLWIHQMKTPIMAASLLLESDSLSADSNALRVKSRLMEINRYANMAMSYLKLMHDSTDMDLTEVRIKPLVTGILKRYALFFIEQDDRVEVELEGSDRVVSDARWLSILIEQLISNAVKYTRGGRILIHFDPEAKVLSIKDTGAGIPKQDLPKIFEKGYSGFNGRATDKSSGLGLFLVDTIARRLSIRIEVQSAVGQGTCFELTFP